MPSITARKGLTRSRATCIGAPSYWPRACEARLHRSNNRFFDTITVDAGDARAAIVEHARAAKLNLRLLLPGSIGIALDETTTPATVEGVWRVFGGQLSLADIAKEAQDAFRQPAAQGRLPEASGLQ
jgi:glycine cleavage system pyridoxal-binding protein P